MAAGRANLQQSVSNAQQTGSTLLYMLQQGA